ncbi:MAG: hypothetical protein QG661_526 [Actinomycetota bacterium]|jgi:hypothetical protein|nr:hypothetical protein [Actinomycetota bacterium]
MVEVTYTGLLIVAMAAAGWFAFYVVYKLFKGQG